MPIHQQPRLDHGVPTRLTETLRQRHLKIRILGCHAEVGQQAQIDPTPHAVAVNLRNRRLRKFPQIQRRPQEQIGGAFVEILERVPEIGIRILVGTPAGHVPAAETFAVGLDDHDFDLAITVGFVQAGVDLLHQRRILGVGLVGPVQDDPRDRRFTFVDNRFQGAPLHLATLLRWPVNQAETGLATFISFIRLPPMILATSSSSKSVSSSTKVIGSLRPSGCGQSEPNSTRSVPTMFTISVNRSSQNGVMYTHRLKASIGSSRKACGIFLYTPLRPLNRSGTQSAPFSIDRIRSSGLRDSAPWHTRAPIASRIGRWPIAKLRNAVGLNGRNSSPGSHTFANSE